MRKNICIEEWFTDGPGLFPFAPAQAALLVIDMTYMCAHRDYGVGKRLKAKHSSFGEYYYSRLENTVVPNIQKLLCFARREGVEVIYFTFGPQKQDSGDLYPIGKMEEQRSAKHGVKGFDATNRKSMSILDEIAPCADELVVNKLSSGAFASSNIDAILRNMGITTLFFAGVCTNMCVESTAREAVDRGYNGIIVDDACATYTQDGHDATLNIFELIYGKITTADAAIEAYPWKNWCE